MPASRLREAFDSPLHPQLLCRQGYAIGRLYSSARERRICIQAWLLWGLLFGSIGLGFFIYGRKQRAPIPLLCGIALMVFPYFVNNTLLLVAIGAVLIAVPYFFRD
jgi:hypothetical protein